jgi:hypothetical protein
MILLCGGEAAAGVKTGGVFFLFVSFGGKGGAGGLGELEAAAAERAVRGLPAELAGLGGGRAPAPRRHVRALELV